jgi:hypothetical protein
MQMWLSVDPMSDKFPFQSSYAYCNNNPIMLHDPDGKEGLLRDNGAGSVTIMMKYVAVTSGPGALSTGQINTVQKTLDYKFGGTYNLNLGGTNLKINFEITVENGGTFSEANGKVQSEYGANLLQLKTKEEINSMKGSSEASEKVIGGVTARIDESGNIVPGVPNASFIDQEIAGSNVQSVFKKAITDEAGHVMGTSHSPTTRNGTPRTLGALENGLNRVNVQDVINMLTCGCNRGANSTALE